MSLLKTLQNRQNRQPAPGPAAPQQEQIQQALQTKATGKVATQAGPKASSLGEAQAFDVAKTQQKQVAQQGQLQQEQLKTQASSQVAQQEQQSQDLESQRQLRQLGIQAKEMQALESVQSQQDLANLQRFGEEKLATQRQSHEANKAFYRIAKEQQFNTSNLLADLKKSNAQLDSDKNIAIYQQRAFLASMRSQKYVDKIKRVGAMSRLEGKIQFQEAATEMILGRRTSRLVTELSFNKEMAADYRTFNAKMKTMAAQDRIDLAMSMLQDEMRAKKWEAGSQAIQTSIMATLSYYNSTTPSNSDVNKHQVAIQKNIQGWDQDFSDISDFQGTPTIPGGMA